MKHLHISRLIYLLLFCCSPLNGFSDEIIPVSYKGRIRPIETYAQLWIYDLYNGQVPLGQVPLGQVPLPRPKQNGSVTDFMWALHEQGAEPYRLTPLFFIKSTELKKHAGLDPTRTHFNYAELNHTLYQNPETSLKIFTPLVIYHSLKAYADQGNRRTTKLELKTLSPGLWVAFQGSELAIKSIPSKAPWNHFFVGQIVASDLGPGHSEKRLHKEKPYVEETEKLLFNLREFNSLEGTKSSDELAFETEYKNLKGKKIQPKEIERALENQYPIMERLRSSGSLLKVLPGRYASGEWFSLHALKTQVYHPSTNELIPINNFTLFSDEAFDRIRALNSRWERALLEKNNGADALHAELVSELDLAYKGLINDPGAPSAVKTGRLPSAMQLAFETFYSRHPLIEISIILYLLATLGLMVGLYAKQKLIAQAGLPLLILAFSFHSLILLIRCYILNRPPVSNMFETVIYVPWIAVLTGLAFRFFTKKTGILVASSVGALILLILLKLTGMSGSLENIQPVLNSQFWLIIHVLMVVGSYGVFVLSGLLGHFYLASSILHQRETSSMKSVAQLILQTMYLGVALLIMGTILGGVWAAESWGRFWDWDPKESWAFISCCVYLMWIHAYRFHKITNFGLAAGAIIGLSAISFTWYGVNYILGTGLHSYGFGFGGQGYYYGFLILEAVFLLAAFVIAKKINKIKDRALF
jgi:ABC-type transport system involved in cytochrome c biogenesis permease subunit